MNLQLVELYLIALSGKVCQDERNHLAERLKLTYSALVGWCTRLLTINYALLPSDECQALVGFTIMCTKTKSTGLGKKPLRIESFNDWGAGAGK